MSSILLFDGDCAACDRVARELVGVQGIELVAASSSRGAQLLNSTSGVSAPCLIEVDEEGAVVKAHQGWAMRMAIARKVGWRHIGRWYPLLKSEVRARQERGSLISRRVTIAGLGLGVVATMMGIPKPAAAVPTGELLDPDEQTRLLSSKSPWLRQALRTWGPATESRRFEKGGAAAVGFLHGTTRVVTYVLTDRPDVAYSLRSSAEGLEVLKPDGSAVGMISVVTSASGAQSLVTTLAAGTEAGPSPDSLPVFTECFIGCMGWNVSLFCILECANNPAFCVCAGLPGIYCAATCAPYLP